MIRTPRLTFTSFMFTVAGFLIYGLPAYAQEPPSLPLHRASSQIRIDGSLSDSGWKDAAKITTFYDVSPGDNTAPPVETTAWITYDSNYLYLAFRCEDPNPSSIRAPFTERDGMTSEEDFAGVFLDTRNSQLTALELFVNPRGIQSDGVKNDATGEEDFSPDFFWDSAARITDHGWDAEMRIPMSSLRYPKTDPQTWGIIFFRNYPRGNRYQLASVRIPRGSNCLLCHEMKLTGITDRKSVV